MRVAVWLAGTEKSRAEFAAAAEFCLASVGETEPFSPEEFDDLRRRVDRFTSPPRVPESTNAALSKALNVIVNNTPAAPGRVYGQFVSISPTRGFETKEQCGPYHAVLVSGFTVRGWRQVVGGSGLSEYKLAWWVTGAGADDEGWVRGDDENPGNTGEGGPFYDYVRLVTEPFPQALLSLPAAATVQAEAVANPGPSARECEMANAFKDLLSSPDLHHPGLPESTKLLVTRALSYMWVLEGDAAQ